MGDYRIIKDISGTLLNLLKTNMDELITPDKIFLGSPADIDKVTDPHLSLFLYQIIEDQYIKNEKMPPLETGNIKFPPLPLNLFYLLTAHAPAGEGKNESEQQIIGRALQIFHDNSIIRGSLLQGVLSGTFEELHLTLYTITIEDMNKLWNMFGSTPYKLSVTYKVATALVDSIREITPYRVTKSTLNYHLST